jgi:dethiobiotin synthetase
VKFLTEKFSGKPFLHDIFVKNSGIMIKSVYVAATSQHVGKTTSTLGLVAALSNRGVKVGYCKPVGQKFLDLGNLRVDKDALLFSKVMDFKLASEIHSPVVLGKGATAAYLDNPSEFDYRDRIIAAADFLQKENDIVIYEGTGHPGVGSVVDLSNADVAKLVNAGVIIIVEGGIGNTIDRLGLCLSKFKEIDVPVIGVIINKVLPEKVEKVRYYVGKKLAQMNIALLGVLPYDKTLQYPILATIKRAVYGRVLANEDSLDNRVEDYMSGSLVDIQKVIEQRNLLLVVSAKRLFEAIDKIAEITRARQLEQSPLSGIILTGDGRHTTDIDNDSLKEGYINDHKIPVITTALDTLGSVIKVSQIEVKINTRTPWKTQRAIELIQDHVNLDAIINSSLIL